MADELKKRNCEVTVEPLKAYINKGDEERYAVHKYMTNPKKWFWETIKEINKRRKK